MPKRPDMPKRKSMLSRPTLRTQPVTTQKEFNNVLIDRTRVRNNLGVVCHNVVTLSTKTLVDFCAAMGISTTIIQYSGEPWEHVDITEEQLSAAVTLGAKVVPPNQIMDLVNLKKNKKQLPRNT